MNLSTHFTLEELTFSETAKRYGVDNTPSPEVLENLKKAAADMEQVRTVLKNNPILVSSGYRCEEVNRLIGSKDTSAHVLGWAIDFRCPAFGSPRDVALAIQKSGIRYDQLIVEFGAWVHVSFNPRYRQMDLTIDSAGTRLGI